MRPEEKERIWRPLGHWVEMRRKEGYLPPKKVETVETKDHELISLKKEEDVENEEVKQEMDDVLEGE